MSTTLQLLLARFPGAVQIPFSSAATAIGMAVQTGRNQLVRGTFPVRTIKLGGRRMVRLDDLAKYLDGAARTSGESGKRRGAPTKEERLEAKRRGVSVRELRAEGGAQ